MRLILYLKSLCDAVYNVEYNHFFQALIYNLLKDTVFDRLHKRGGYKFFCFSNIFPPEDLRVGVIRKIMVSSPSIDFINVLYSKLQDIETLKIGSMIFEIEKIIKFECKISESSVNLITGTPIIVRIPRKKAERHSIPVKEYYDYVYWRLGMPLKIFLEQLEVNLIKKWKRYYGLTPPGDAFPLFISRRIVLEPLKEVSTRVHYKSGTQIVVGTTWRFLFKELNRSQAKLLRFGVETGFGEMNSQGFGFINIEK